MTPRKLIGFQATIKHDAHIRHALLLVFIGIQCICITRTGAPVDGMRGITRLIFAHAEELCSAAACTCGNCPSVDTCATRTNHDVADAHYWRKDEQASLRFHADPCT